MPWPFLFQGEKMAMSSHHSGGKVALAFTIGLGVMIGMGFVAVAGWLWSMVRPKPAA